MVFLLFGIASVDAIFFCSRRRGMPGKETEEQNFDIDEISIPKIIKKYGMDKIDILKIDIEGSEITLNEQFDKYISLKRNLKKSTK